MTSQRENTANEIWMPWAGAGLTFVAILLRHSGFGLSIALLGLAAAVAFPLRVWESTPSSRRLPLLVAPAVIAALLFIVYLSSDHGRRIGSPSPESIGTSVTGSQF